MTRASMRVLAIAIAGIATVASVQVIARSDQTTPKPPPPVSSEEQPPRIEADDAIPVTGDAPAGTRCDGSWFENPTLRYGLCVPVGWGFTDFTTASPLTLIPRRQLPSVRLLSPGGFPWHPGDAPFEVTRDRGVIDVELNVLEPSVDPGCDAIVLLRLGLRGCEQRIDALGLPSPSGALTATKVVVPLDPATQLLVIGRTSSGSLPEEVDRLWQLIGSIAAVQ